MRSVLLGSLRTHARRYLAAALAVVVGVSFVIVTGALSAAGRDGMQAGLAAPYAGADLVVSGVGQRQADRLLAAAEAEGAEAGALATVFVPVSRSGREVAPDARVGAVADAPALQWQDLVAGAFPTGRGQAVVDADQAAALDLSVGDDVRIGRGARALDMRVVGLVEVPVTAPGSTLFVTWADLSAVSGRVFVDALSWAGDDPVEAERASLAELVPQALVQSPAAYVDSVQQRANDGIDVLTLLLLLFASVALVVAVIVIANTFSILFAQRRRDLALLRCVGATRRQVQRSIRLEALAIGIGASLLGLGLGLGLGRAVVAILGQLAPGMALGTPRVGPGWYAAGLVVGLVVTLVASWLPTRAAVRADPLAALRPETGVDVRTGAGRARLGLGLLGILAGVAVLALAVHTRQVLPMVAGGTSVFVGVLLIGPLLVPALIRRVGWLAGRVVGTPGRLATDNAVRNPRRTATTTASLLVGVTLTTAVLTGLASSRAALSSELDRQHPLDGAVVAIAPLPDDLATSVAGLPGVDAAVAVRGVAVRVPGLGRTVALGAGDDALALGRGENAATTLRPGLDQVALPPGSGVGEGSPVVLTAGETRFRMTAVLGEGWGQAALVAPATLARLASAAGTGPAPYAIWAAAPDADAAELAANLRSVTVGLDGSPDTVAGLQERAFVDLQLDVLTGVVVGLLGIAVLIALVGIANTLGLSVLERSRENALLRALGLTRRQLRLTLAVEAVLLTVTATLIGTLLGVAFAWVGVQVMVLSAVAEAPLAVPVGQLGLVVAVAAVSGLLAGVLPARRAARTAPAAGLAVA